MEWYLKPNESPANWQREYRRHFQTLIQKVNRDTAEKLSCKDRICKGNPHTISKKRKEKFNIRLKAVDHSAYDASLIDISLMGLKATSDTSRIRPRGYFPYFHRILWNLVTAILLRLHSQQWNAFQLTMYLGTFSHERRQKRGEMTRISAGWQSLWGSFVPPVGRPSIPLFSFSSFLPFLLPFFLLFFFLLRWRCFSTVRIDPLPESCITRVLSIGCRRALHSKVTKALK